MRTCASGRRPARRSMSSSTRRQPSAAPLLARAPTGTSRAICRRAAPATATGSGSMAIALRPDPASRFQPDGPHGPSEIVDPAGVRVDRRRLARASRPTGRCSTSCTSARSRPKAPGRAAAAQLPALARLGITVIEVMPVADFAGRFGWGYDGVDLFAPTRLYGTPDDLRALRRSRARARPRRHPRRRLQPPRARRQLPARVLARLLHRPLRRTTGARRSTSTAPTPAVREFFVANAGYWIDEFHFDGLRLDATQDIYDASPRAHPRRRSRAGARGGRRHAPIVLVAENEPQDTRLVRAAGSGRLRPRRAVERRLSPHRGGRADRPARGVLHATTRGTPQEFISAAKYGFLYQGQWYAWQKKRRGTPALDLPPTRLRHLPREPRSGRQLRVRPARCTS